jgi:hypothetical protein
MPLTRRSDTARRRYLTDVNPLTFQWPISKTIIIFVCVSPKSKAKKDQFKDVFCKNHKHITSPSSHPRHNCLQWTVRHHFLDFNRDHQKLLLLSFPLQVLPHLWASSHVHRRQHQNCPHHHHPLRLRKPPLYHRYQFNHCLLMSLSISLPRFHRLHPRLSALTIQLLM